MMDGAEMAQGRDGPILSETAFVPLPSPSQGKTLFLSVLKEKPPAASAADRALYPVWLSLAGEGAKGDGPEMGDWQR